MRQLTGRLGKIQPSVWCKGLMAGNNHTYTLYDLQSIGAKSHNILLFNSL